MALLYGVAKVWYSDAEVRERLDNGGIQNLVATAKGAPMVVKDNWHLIANRSLVRAVMECMMEQKMKTPCKETILAQVQTLDLLHEKVSFNALNLPPVDPSKEVLYHIQTTNIKKLISYVRRVRLRPHTPRDRGLWALVLEREPGYHGEDPSNMFSKVLEKKVCVLWHKGSATSRIWTSERSWTTSVIWILFCTK